MLSEILREAAEMAVFEFFCLLDGVSAIEDVPNKGELELHFVKADKRERLNDPKQEELHDLFNGLCREGSGLQAPAGNPDINPYDIGEAKDLKSMLKVGDGLDIHHVPDKSIHAVGDHHPNSAPAVALPKFEHRQIFSQSQ